MKRMLSLKYGLCISYFTAITCTNSGLIYWNQRECQHSPLLVIFRTPVKTVTWVTPQEKLKAHTVYNKHKKKHGVTFTIIQTWLLLRCIVSTLSHSDVVWSCQQVQKCPMVLYVHVGWSREKFSYFDSKMIPEYCIVCLSVGPRIATAYFSSSAIPPETL